MAATINTTGPAMTKAKPAVPKCDPAMPAPTSHRMIAKPTHGDLPTANHAPSSVTRIDASKKKMIHSVSLNSRHPPQPAMESLAVHPAA